MRRVLKTWAATVGALALARKSPGFGKNQSAHTAPPDLLRKLEQGLPTMREILDSKADPVPFNAWIAEQLHLGHVSRVNQCAHTAPPDLLRKLEQACPP